eukprot:364001-Chlamydomonas_euryale.AAC.2
MYFGREIGSSHHLRDGPPKRERDGEARLASRGTIKHRAAHTADDTIHQPLRHWFHQQVTSQALLLASPACGRSVSSRSHDSCITRRRHAVACRTGWLARLVRLAALRPLPALRSPLPQRRHRVDKDVLDAVGVVQLHPPHLNRKAHLGHPLLVWWRAPQLVERPQRDDRMPRVWAPRQQLLRAYERGVPRRVAQRQLQRRRCPQEHRQRARGHAAAAIAASAVAIAAADVAAAAAAGRGRGVA